MRQVIILGLLLAILFILPFCPTARADVGTDIALVLKVTGQAQVKKLSPELWQEARKGSRLNSGDVVRTRENTLVAVVFTDDRSMLKIRSNSEVTIRGERQKTTIAKRLFMGVGEVWAKVKEGSAFELETPAGVAAVKGTEFYGQVLEDGSLIVVGIIGFVELRNALGAILIGAGKTGTMSKDKTPESKDTQNFYEWAKELKIEEELEFEFEDQNGSKEHLKIKFKE